jgi:hypothetical protein
MKRDEAIHELRPSRKELQESLSGLSEELFLRPKAFNKWMLKDLVAHIASWDEEVVRVLQTFALPMESVFTYSISESDDFAVWNQAQVDLRRERSVGEILSELETSRRDLIQVVEGLTDPVLNRSRMTSWGMPATGFELIIRQVAHDREHAEQVRKYRRKMERWQRARKNIVEKRKANKK